MKRFKRCSTPFICLMIAVLIGTTAPYAPPIVRADTAAVPPIVDDWVQISTTEQLIYMNEHQEDYLSRNIRLMNAIDLAGHAWIPFGGNEHPVFSGTFDGNGYVVSGVTIHDDSLDSVGFFGTSSGHIRNLGVEVHIQGGVLTGGLVGWQEGGAIDRSYSTGSVQGTAIRRLDHPSSATGGLVGTANHTAITRSYSTASAVSGNMANSYVGGLIGSTGSSHIADTYATGLISNDPTPAYLYSSGLIGFTIHGVIDRSYTAGSIDIPPLSGVPNKLLAAFANIAGTATVNDSYYDSTTIGIDPDVDASGAIGRTTDEMKRAESYTGWDFTDIWAIHPAVNDGYPYLRPAILTTELPAAIKDSAYAVTLTAFNGAGGVLTWSASGLPTGLTLSSDGVLQGIPVQSGVFHISLTATDTGSASASTNLTLTVNERAPELQTFRVAPGSEFGSASVTAEPRAPEHSFYYIVGTEAEARPLIHDPLPAEATAYSLGVNIRNVIPGQYLTVYEVNGDLLIQAWSSVRLASEHIQMDVPVTGVRIEPAGLTLTVGQAPYKLTAVVEPEHASNRNVVWSSSDPDVAEVHANGEVTPIAGGTAVITATTQDGAYTANIVVAVSPIPPTAGTVTGSVYGAGDAPLPGAHASIDGMHATTDESGSFTLYNVAEGSRTVTISAYGYHTREISVNVIAGDMVDTGKIMLAATEPDSDEESPVSPPSGPTPSPVRDRDRERAEPERMTVRMNGIDVSVPVTREQTSDGRSAIRLTLDASLVSALYATAHDAVITVDNRDPIVILDMPVGALQDVLSALPEAGIEIQVNGAGYKLPLSIWKDVPHEAIVAVTIAMASEADNDTLSPALAGEGVRRLATPVDFTIQINDRTMESFGGIYVERSITLDTAAIDHRKTTVVWVDPDGKLHFVPSIFTVQDGTVTAVFYAPHNSTYAVIEADRTFADIREHWARRDIERLANKLILYGVDDDAFAPDGRVTRAEWTAMLVRALGLAKTSGASEFADVPANAWYAGAVNAARGAALIRGTSDGMFQPDALITREEMAVMATRAISFAGTLPTADTSAAGRFADADRVSDWAKEPIALMLETGIMNGVSDTALAPKLSATRGEAATVLKRMLQYLQFIDE